MLKEGDAAPDFRTTADDGRTVSLADYRGKNLILYFYPKANTSGCTNESIQFRDALPKFRAVNAEIVGCSGDTVQAQTKFKQNYALNFPLLADTEFQVVEAYGARRMKSFYGKSFLGIVRSTFWIGPDGKVRRVWPKVKVEGHAAEVLAAVQSAQEPARAAAHQ